MSEMLIHSPEVEQQETFGEFVLKVNSRCQLQPKSLPSVVDTAQVQNLIRLRKTLGPVDPVQDQESGGCDYCVEYVGNDLWKREEPRMKIDTARQAAYRINEHANTHGLESVRIVLHGGEPLALSPDYLDELLTTIDEQIETKKYFIIQTNGISLDEARLAVLQKHKQRLEEKYDYGQEGSVQVGLSIDGDRMANDRHRRTQSGRSTFDQVFKATGLLRTSGLTQGRLSVIDDRNEPEHTLEFLASTDPDAINVFPSLRNHSTGPRPTGPEHLNIGPWLFRAAARYFNWDLYHPDEEGNVGTRAPFRMKSIDAQMLQLLGGTSAHERVGNRYTHELFVTPSGRWQRLDALKSADNGAVETSMNVFEHSLDYFAAHDPGVRARRLASTAIEVGMAEECTTCPIFDVCGGGYYPNRYRQIPLDQESSMNEFVTAFRNPDADCAELKYSIGHLIILLEKEGGVVRDRALSSDEMDATLSSHGVAMKAGNYIQSCLDEQLLTVEEECPDSVVKIVRRLNQEFLSTVSSEGDKFSDSLSLDEDTYLALYEYAHSHNSTGRLGVQLARILHEHPTQVSISHGYTPPSRGYRGTSRLSPVIGRPQQTGWSGERMYSDVGYYKDPDDAIVQALVLESDIGRGFKPPKRLGTTFVATSQQIDALYAARDTLEGFVYNEPFDESQLRFSIAPGANLTRGWDSANPLDFTYGTDSYGRQPLRVQFKDLPPDLFVLEIPGATQEETESLLEHISKPTIYSKYKNPYALNEALKQCDQPAYLLPLSGFWTPHTNHPDWFSPNKRVSDSATPLAIRSMRLQPV
jgi:uncharacterized protein